ncbi:uncharacterized protein LOC120090624 [Benincasa hispida]|uniref:uncharacterized protein LOC120090624 n=1 Tax=Benincasa hispida TaxID=102211 RepID=UPI001901E97A|nr:uncharacterized protein LOC120090624 [Benincasa hispida]
MGPFPSSNGHKYILLVVDYVSKWIEPVSCIANDAATVSKFLQRNIFTGFGTLHTIVSDEGTHFVNRIINKLLIKYNFYHMIATAYDPQKNRQVEGPNKEIKSVLEKMVNPSRKDWAMKLDDALWAYRIDYQIPIGMSPYALVFGKACHLPLELEYKELWAIKKLNFYLNATGEERKHQLLELDEWRLQAYENAKIYKEWTKQ